MGNLKKPIIETVAVVIPRPLLINLNTITNFMWRHNICTWYRSNFVGVDEEILFRSGRRWAAHWLSGSVDQDDRKFLYHYGCLVPPSERDGKTKVDFYEFEGTTESLEEALLYIYEELK